MYTLPTLTDDVDQDEETPTMSGQTAMQGPGVVRRTGPGATPPGRLDRASLTLIAIAAMLWASDVFFRTGLVRRGLSSGEIVFAEDLLITLAFVPLARRIWRDIRGIPLRSCL